MKRITIFVIIAVLLLGLVGCKTETGPSYSKFCSGDDEAIDALKSAIATLDDCANGKITVEDAVEDLEIIINRLKPGETQVQEITCTRLSVSQRAISLAALKEKYGDITHNELMQAVEAERDKLLGTLYE